MFSVDRQRLEQREVLEHHADAETLRLARAGHRDPLAVPHDLAGIGRRHAVDDLHQRALAGAVLAQQRVDLVALDRERDAVIGQHAGVLLGDPGHPQQRPGLGRGGRRRVQAGGGAQVSLPSTPSTSHCMPDSAPSSITLPAASFSAPAWSFSGPANTWFLPEPDVGHRSLSPAPPRRAACWRRATSPACRCRSRPRCRCSSSVPSSAAPMRSM